MKRDNLIVFLFVSILDFIMIIELFSIGQLQYFDEVVCIILLFLSFAFSLTFFLNYATYFGVADLIADSSAFSTCCNS